MSAGARKILVVAPSWVGDAVMAEPMLARLKVREPAAHITVFCAPFLKPLFERMRAVDATLDNPFGHGEVNLRGRFALARTLRAQRFDQAIVLPNSLKSALIPLVARIARRTGFKGEARYGLINDLRHLDKTRVPLMIERFAVLAEAHGAQPHRPVKWPRLKPNDLNCTRVLAELSLDTTRPIAVLAPGAEFGPAKRWPAEHFAASARKLAARGFAVWLMGSAADAPIAAQIQRLCDGACHDLTGRTSLGDAIDLISLAAIVVCNDSGLMHIACALDRAVVAAFGSSSPAFTPPLAARARAISLKLECSPCFARECPLGHLNCLRQLSPERVLTEIDKLREVSDPR